MLDEDGAVVKSYNNYMRDAMKARLYEEKEEDKEGNKKKHWWQREKDQGIIRPKV